MLQRAGHDKTLPTFWALLAIWLIMVLSYSSPFAKGICRATGCQSDGRVWHADPATGGERNASPRSLITYRCPHWCSSARARRQPLAPRERCGNGDDEADDPHEADGPCGADVVGQESSKQWADA